VYFNPHFCVSFDFIPDTVLPPPPPPILYLCLNPHFDQSEALFSYLY
jgi:hypothetical protein